MRKTMFNGNFMNNARQSSGAESPGGYANGQRSHFDRNGRDSTTASNVGSPGLGSTGNQRTSTSNGPAVSNQNDNFNIHV